MPEDDSANMADPQPVDPAKQQQQNCIFCHIISGKVQSKKVYEDEETIGILDINPANPGHVLLLPKKHYAIMPQMNDLEIGHIFMVAKSMSGALLKALKADGTNIFVANGAIAGQKAPHFIAHVIPRKEGDKLTLNIPEHKISIAELLKIQEMLLPRIKVHMGLTDADIEAWAAETKALKQVPQPASAAKTIPAAPQAQIQQTSEQMPIPDIPGKPNDEEIDLDAISGIINPRKSVPIIPTFPTKEEPVHEKQDANDSDKERKVTLSEIEGLFKHKKKTENPEL